MFDKSKFFGHNKDVDLKLPKHEHSSRNLSAILCKFENNQEKATRDLHIFFVFKHFSCDNSIFEGIM